MDGNVVDASVAIKRTNGKQEAAQTPHARPAAEHVSSTAYNQIQGLPQGLSGVYLKAAITLLESPVGDRVFRTYAGWQPGLLQIFQVSPFELAP